MTKVQIYDKAMCCSTGICGPQVDPVLPKFSADLDWLKDQGHDVVRFNLAQDPAEFAKNRCQASECFSSSMEPRDRRLPSLEL